MPRFTLHLNSVCAWDSAGVFCDQPASLVSLLNLWCLVFCWVKLQHSHLFPLLWKPLGFPWHCDFTAFKSPSAVGFLSLLLPAVISVVSEGSCWFAEQECDICPFPEISYKDGFFIYLFIVCLFCFDLNKSLFKMLCISINQYTQYSSPSHTGKSQLILQQPTTMRLYIIVKYKWKNPYKYSLVSLSSNFWMLTISYLILVEQECRQFVLLSTWN